MATATEKARQLTPVDGGQFTIQLGATAAQRDVDGQGRRSLQSGQHADQIHQPLQLRTPL